MLFRNVEENVTIRLRHCCKVGITTEVEVKAKWIEGRVPVIRRTGSLNQRDRFLESEEQVL